MSTVKRHGRNSAPRLRPRGLSALLVLLVVASLGGCKAIDAIENLTNPSIASSRSLTLRTSTSTLPDGGGDVELEATVRVGDAPESGVPVTFSSTSGTFVDGATAMTDSDGKARVVLRVATSVEVSASMIAAGMTVAESTKTTITVGNDVVPNGSARFDVTTDPKRAESGDPVVIEVKASNATDGSWAAGVLRIEFGDGKQVTVADFKQRAAVQHTYKEPSIFNIVVSLTDKEGKLSRDTVPLNVVDGTNTALAFSAASADWFAREELEFTVELTEDGQRNGSGNVTIDWGDGRTTKLGDIVGTVKPMHQYRERGGYRARATLTTANGKTSSASFHVRIGDPISVEGSLSASQTAQVNESVAFVFTANRSDESRPTGIVNVNFADGSATQRYSVSSSSTRFEHAFTREGSFAVKADYVDDDSLTAKAATTITVTLNNDGGGGGGGDDDGGGGGGGGGDQLNADSIRYLHADVSNWAVTSTTTAVSVTPSQICISHTKAGQWQSIGGVEGNPWVVANIGGTWYAATYEWLRPGQICKALGVPQEQPNTARSIGPHTKRSPLATWVPKKGETVYFFVSTLSRDSKRNGNQRSNITKIVWPY